MFVAPVFPAASHSFLADVPVAPERRRARLPHPAVVQDAASPDVSFVRPTRLGNHVCEGRNVRSRSSASDRCEFTDWPQFTRSCCNPLLLCRNAEHPFPTSRASSLKLESSLCEGTRPRGAVIYIVRTLPADYGGCGGDPACAYCCGTDRGIPVPQVMPERGGGTACAVCIPQVQFLDKVDVARCCTMTGACGLTEQKTVEVPQFQCSDRGNDVPVVQVVVWVSWKVPQIQFIARVRGPSSLQ